MTQISLPRSVSLDPCRNLASLASLIQYSLCAYIGMHPDGKYEDAVEFALKDVMRATKGMMNPAVAKKIIQMEKSVFERSKYMLPC